MKHKFWSRYQLCSIILSAKFRGAKITYANYSSTFYSSKNLGRFTDLAYSKALTCHNGAVPSIVLTELGKNRKHEELAPIDARTCQRRSRDAMTVDVIHERIKSVARCDWLAED